MYMEHGGTWKKWVWHIILHLDVVFFLFAGSVKSFGYVRSLGDRTSNITNTNFQAKKLNGRTNMGFNTCGTGLDLQLLHDSFQTIFTRSPLPHNFWCQSWSSIEIMASQSWSLQGFTSFSILNYLRFRIDKWDQTSDIQDSQVQYRVSERYEFDPLPGILMLWSPWSHTRTLIRWRFAWDLQFNCQPFLQFDRVSSHVAPFVPWTSHQ